MKTTDHSHSAVINLCVHFAKVSLGVTTEPEKNQVKKKIHTTEKWLAFMPSFMTSEDESTV